jgi:hypothetical protein
VPVREGVIAMIFDMELVLALADFERSGSKALQTLMDILASGRCRERRPNS